MSTKRIIVLILCLGFCLNTLAGVQDSVYRKVKDTAVVKAAVSGSAKNLKSLETEFTQSKKMDIINGEIISQGYFCYKNGNMVRWEYTSPFQYLIIINNGKLNIRQEGQTQQLDLTSNEAFLQINTRLNSFITGTVLDDSRDFRFSYYENSRNYKIVLHPLADDMKIYFKSIDVYFDKTEFVINRLTLREVNGDLTDIRFFKRKVNQKLDDSKFILN